MSTTLHKLIVELGLDPKGFDKGLDSAIGKAKNAGVAFRKVGLDVKASFMQPRTTITFDPEDVRRWRRTWLIDGVVTKRQRVKEGGGV